MKGVTIPLMLAVCAIWTSLLFVPVLIIPWDQRELMMAGGSGLLLVTETLTCLIATATLFFTGRTRVQRMLVITGLALSIYYSFGLGWRAWVSFSVGCYSYDAEPGPGLWISFGNIVLFGLALFFSFRKSVR